MVVTNARNVVVQARREQLSDRLSNERCALWVVHHELSMTVSKPNISVPGFVGDYSNAGITLAQISAIEDRVNLVERLSSRKSLVIVPEPSFNHLYPVA